MKIVQTDHFLRNSSNKLKKKIILLAEDKNNILWEKKLKLFKDRMHNIRLNLLLLFSSKEEKKSFLF